ncbi:MAG TPA: VWA domain-containing protein [Candidatus Sulfotelmatobacter sp.]
MDKTGTVALLALILLVPQGYAQTAPSSVPGPPTPASATSTPVDASQGTPATKAETPTIITNVEEVTLDLVVHNTKNKPILDLKPEDIAVMDNGSAVRLSDLRLVTGASSAEHSVTLVFDRLAPSAAKNAHDIATKILKTSPANGFSFSVLKVGRRLRLFQEFTSDRVAVETAIGVATEKDDGNKEDASALPEQRLIAIAQTGTDSSGARISTKDRNAARIMLASLQESQRIVQDQHCQSSLASLLALARIQRQIAGRKVVIFFAQGLMADSNTRDMLRSVIGAANRSGVSIYAIDTNAIDDEAGEGLIASAAIATAAPSISRAASSPTSSGSGPGMQSLPQLPPGMQAQISDTLSQIEFEGLSGYRNPLAELAGSTGGAYIVPTDNLKKPLQQLFEDMTTYYEASYVPPIKEYDGKFRPVAVKPVRGGLKIRSRAGYFALPPGPGSGMKPFEAPLMKLLSESQLPSDLKFHSAVLRLGVLPDGNENVLVIEVPVTELETRDDPNSNLYSVHLSIVAQIKNKAGEVIEHFSEDVPRHASLDSQGTAGPELITMQRPFLADPGGYVVEAAVLDRNSQKAGAQRLEFEIPGEASGPSLSDVTIVQRIEPSPAEIDSTEPMRYGTGKVVPSVSGNVPRGVKDISFFFVIHPDPNSAEQPRLEMEVLKSNEQIALLPMQLRKTAGPVSIPYLASIQSASLSSGDYEVIERLMQNGKTAEHAVAFRIEGPELASATAPAPGNATSEPPSDDAAVASSQLPGNDGHAGRHLVITSLPDGTFAAPSPDQLEAIVAGARKRALDYTETLPNFICVEATSRSVDQSGNGNWKHRDSLAELLTYHNGQESRTTLQVNGKRSSLKRADLNSTWPISVGEFGALLKLVFSPSSKTVFQWKEAATLGDGTGTVQVLSYRVAHENATINLSEGNNSLGVGFHGLVYIDRATSGIRRLTVEADGLPRSFSMHAATMTVDYDYVAISARDYLLPVRSTVSLQRGRKQIELNEIGFRNYRRFASRTKIKMVQ